MKEFLSTLLPELNMRDASITNISLKLEGKKVRGSSIIVSYRMEITLWRRKT